MPAAGPVSVSVVKPPRRWNRPMDPGGGHAHGEDERLVDDGEPSPGSGKKSLRGSVRGSSVGLRPGADTPPCRQPSLTPRTHTHTTQSLTHSHSLTLSLSHTHSFTHMHTLTQILTHTLAHTHSLARTVCVCASARHRWTCASAVVCAAREAAPVDALRDFVGVHVGVRVCVDVDVWMLLCFFVLVFDFGRPQSKNAWTADEDEKLRLLMETMAGQCWSDIAVHLPGRAGKQCRERCVVADLFPLPLPPSLTDTPYQPLGTPCAHWWLCLKPPSTTAGGSRVACGLCTHAILRAPGYRCAPTAPRRLTGNAGGTTTCAPR